MVYEQEQIKEIAEEVKRFMLENRLAEDFIKHISGNHNKGRPVPKMEEFVDNGCLRYELICFLSYRLSIMKDTEQKARGSLLVEVLEMISGRTQRIERNEMEQTAWDVADLLKDVDYFKFAEYMKCMDDPSDPVRRLYMDLKIPEKRTELADYLLKFTDTELWKKYGVRLQNWKTWTAKYFSQTERKKISTGDKRTKAKVQIKPRKSCL